ncbi:hypothetical protein [Bacillus sp. 165]|uniref:hypothetical protein n=1 Tax=Bacillus sp. 165 TaxID=1529117 RepID=UPI001ADA1922|nr:hypothetical protein [Bacillus sp. 165]MBO9128540.1 hypothetical protein [Bacillus sp. 165]
MQRKIVITCLVAMLITLLYINMGRVSKAYATSKLHLTDEKIVKVVSTNEAMQYITEMEQGKG